MLQPLRLNATQRLRRIGSLAFKIHFGVARLQAAKLGVIVDGAAGARRGPQTV